MPQQPGQKIDYDALAEEARQQAKQQTSQPATADHLLRDTATDIGVGALKSTGRNVLDLTRMAAKMNPVNVAMMAAGVPEKYRMGYTPPKVDEMLTETNRAQNVGGRAADVLSAVIPAGMALRGARAASAAKSALPMTSALSAPAKGLTAAEFLATLENSAAPTTATVTPTASVSNTIPTLLRRGASDAIKYGAGGAVANELRRWLTGGQ